jgi:hypothetical protein
MAELCIVFSLMTVAGFVLKLVLLSLWPQHGKKKWLNSVWLKTRGKTILRLLEVSSIVIF